MSLNVIKYKDISDIVLKHAKYQKVMLLYDDSVSNAEIGAVHNEIKTNCVYNQMDIKSFDLNEINNGYKMIIYMCSASSMLLLNLNRDEFVNVYIPTDGGIMPFCFNKGIKQIKDAYLVAVKNIPDIAIFSSIIFNKFFYYINNVANGQYCEIMDINLNLNVTTENLVATINGVNNEVEFIDLKILGEVGLNYELLGLLDLILIDAFILFLDAIKQKHLMLVDVYKLAKEDNVLIDKLFSMAKNNELLYILELNYNSLINIAYQTKQNILNYLNFVNIEKREVDLLITKVKEWLKQENSLLSYFYLYDIFSF